MDFYQMLEDYYDIIFPFKQDRFSFFLKLCQEEGVERVLDVGCGTGTYVLAFLKEGYKAIGVDLHQGMIKQARERALTLGLTPSFKKGDMLELPSLFKEPFQLLTCCGNTLPHLNSLPMIAKAIKGMGEVLAAKGLLLVQLVNYDKVLREKITSLPTIKREGITFERNYSFTSSGSIDFKGTLMSEKGVAQGQVPLYPIKGQELKGLMEKAGFDFLTFYHDFQSTPLTFGEGAPLGLVVVGKKA